MRVAVVGAGRVGTAVAVLLGRAGHRIVAVSGRGATRDRASTFLPGVPVRDHEGSAAEGDLVLVGVPDDLIAETVAELAEAGAFHAGQWVAHLSGATGLDALDPARLAGARRLGIHPLQTFPDVAGAIDRIPGCVMALTADDEEGYGVAQRIAADLLGEPFRLPDTLRPLYHAAAVFASNYLVATTGVAEQLLAMAGVPDPIGAIHPLQEATLQNVRRLGTADALTGPALRGDVGTIERNLEALQAQAPWAVAAYVEMARIALDLAVRSGRLPEDRRRAVEEALGRWT